MEGRATLRLWAGLLALTTVVSGCGRERWPSPPSVDPSAYEKEHDAWLAGEQAYLSEILPIIGIWPLDEGASSFQRLTSRFARRTARRSTASSR